MVVERRKEEREEREGERGRGIRGRGGRLNGGQRDAMAERGRELLHYPRILRPPRSGSVKGRQHGI